MGLLTRTVPTSEKRGRKREMKSWGSTVNKYCITETLCTYRKHGVCKTQLYRSNSGGLMVPGGFDTAQLSKIV